MASHGIEYPIGLAVWVSLTSLLWQWALSQLNPGQGINKIFSSPYVLQAEQKQSPEHVLVHPTVQPLTTLIALPDWLLSVLVFLLLGLDTAQQMGYHQSQGQQESIIPTHIHAQAHVCAHVQTRPLDCILWVTAHIKNVVSTPLRDLSRGYSLGGIASAHSWMLPSQGPLNLYLSPNINENVRDPYSQ